MQLKGVIKPCNIGEMAHISSDTGIYTTASRFAWNLPFWAKRTENFSQIIVCRSMKPTVLWSWKEVPRLDLFHIFLEL